jgi:hypothetical protein
MAAMTGRGPETVLRVLGVVALAAVAALALQARQGLDWGELADPVEVHWARVLLGSVVLLVLLAFARRLLRQLRKARPTPSDDDETEPEGEPLSRWLKGLGALVVLAALGMVWFVISSIGTPAPGEREFEGQIVTGTGERAARPSLDTGTTWQVLLVVGTVLLATALGSRWLAARRAAEIVEDPVAEERAEVDALVAAVDAADEGLSSSADPRAAVLAAYAAMARQLSRGLVRHGRESRPSDTAGELLDRAVEAGLVNGSPARELTDLFREARFSEHPMDEGARSTARRCLAQVRSELVTRRV